MLACVSDSYNIFDAVDMVGTELRQRILNRNGIFIMRPDSGDLVEVIIKVLCGL